MIEDKPKHRPVQDEAPDEPEQHRTMPPGHESRGIDKNIADADKRTRVGNEDEPVRNTPPAGEWNDIAPD